MVDKKKKKMVITTLVCVLVFIAVGYALLTQAIKVGVEGTLNGVWDVYISDIKLTVSRHRDGELSITSGNGTYSLRTFNLYGSSYDRIAVGIGDFALHSTIMCHSHRAGNERCAKRECNFLYHKISLFW